MNGPAEGEKYTSSSVRRCAVGEVMRLFLLLKNAQNVNVKQWAVSSGSLPVSVLTWHILLTASSFPTHSVGTFFYTQDDRLERHENLDFFFIFTVNIGRVYVTPQWSGHLLRINKEVRLYCVSTVRPAMQWRTCLQPVTRGADCSN